MVPSGAYLAADALQVSGSLRVFKTKLDERELISSTSVDRG